MSHSDQENNKYPYSKYTTPLLDQIYEYTLYNKKNFFHIISFIHMKTLPFFLKYQKAVFSPHFFYHVLYFFLFLFSP